MKLQTYQTPQNYTEYTRLPYTADAYGNRRRQTRVVMVGAIGVGGDNPIRVQSMTTTDTLDTEGTVAEAIRLVNIGCEIVRITTPTAKDAENLRNIRAELEKRGVHVPLVADIHFNPNAAMEAAKWADKVRINPGNFADAKRFAIVEYTTEDYKRELERIEQKFKPLLLRCKELGRSIRIGTNHGSLSDRIMNYYGDTPEGMVESAMEFALIAEQYDFHDLIFSMKASNPKVMIQAYRLLAARLDALGMNYPFHLGVTEAGNGEDGRIKSAIGIGSLLEDGIGDTIRVSLTEDPEQEIPVALRIARRYSRIEPSLLEKAAINDELNLPPVSEWPLSDLQNKLPDNRTPYHFEKRETTAIQIGDLTIGGDNLPLVISDLAAFPAEMKPKAAGRVLKMAGASSHAAPSKPDLYEYNGDLSLITHKLNVLVKVSEGFDQQVADGFIVDANSPILGFNEKPIMLIAQSAFGDVESELQALANHEYPAVEQLLKVVAAYQAQNFAKLIVGLQAQTAAYTLRANRLLATYFAQKGYRYPIILIAPPVPTNAPLDEHFINGAIALGALLTDGIGNLVQVPTIPNAPHLDAAQSVQLAFNILQAAGARSTKAEFIACPSCGRTLFNLQETTERIKAETGHLVGVKIAIMGCIVNGLGELADADFGYMGGAPGKVNLFVGKECIEKGVPTEEAVSRLIEIIKSRGRWIEPDSGEEEKSSTQRTQR